MRIANEFIFALSVLQSNDYGPLHKEHPLVKKNRDSHYRFVRSPHNCPLFTDSVEENSS
jgi:hypothetical protein